MKTKQRAKRRVPYGNGGEPNCHSNGRSETYNIDIQQNLLVGSIRTIESSVDATRVTGDNGKGSHGYVQKKDANIGQCVTQTGKRWQEMTDAKCAERMQTADIACDENIAPLLDKGKQKMYESSHEQQPFTQDSFDIDHDTDEFWLTCTEKWDINADNETPNVFGDYMQAECHSPLPVQLDNSNRLVTGHEIQTPICKGNGVAGKKLINLMAVVVDRDLIDIRLNKRILKSIIHKLECILRSKHTTIHLAQVTTAEQLGKTGQGLRTDIVEGLIELLDEHNELVRLFRTARDKMADADIPRFKVHMFGVVGSKQHELPAGDSIGAIVFEGGTDVETDFDVIVEQSGGEPQRINKLNPSYMSLQLPLIFIFGEEGYHLGRYLVDDNGLPSDPPKVMSMKMYYAKMEGSSSIVPIAESKGKEIITQQQSIGLADLKTTDTDKTIYVRAYRKWTPINRQGKPALFCCMLIDAQIDIPMPITQIKPEATITMPTEATPQTKKEESPTTPPTQQPTLEQVSKPPNQPAKKTARKALFQGNPETSTAENAKKSKKEN
ncbi:hypothetical protein CTI12_AA136210 [Artemisia annua]|uniref:Helitron helicase-like domain-containing protein n=1 Tax=Artemisia annua TaxID=35608 RepID=A0A2U1PMR1_ARTAN|nr:hypothetical protein CTI12_AA136210 [Artemisia annua]